MTKTPIRNGIFVMSSIVYSTLTTALLAEFVLISEHAVNGLGVKLQTFDANQSLLRFHSPFPDSITVGVDVDPIPSTETLAQILLNFSNTDESNVTDPCLSVLLYLTEQGGNFTNCLLKHARPFRICENCIEQFTRFSHLYEDLLNDDRCSPLLLMADRMQVITTVFNIFVATWADADCTRCYIAVVENSTSGHVTYNYTKQTLRFLSKHDNVSHCFNDSNSVGDHGVNAVCSECKPVYRDLNNDFTSLNQDNDGHVCMDLVDMMNYTRLAWSSKFNCTRPHPDASAVIAISVLACVTTILLYSTTKCITKIRMPQIFKAKRMTPGSSRYGAIPHEDVETSLPRFASQSSFMERRGSDNYADYGFHNARPQAH